MDIFCLHPSRGLKNALVIMPVNVNYTAHSSAERNALKRGLDSVNQGSASLPPVFSSDCVSSHTVVLGSVQFNTVTQ